MLSEARVVWPGPDIWLPRYWSHVLKTDTCWLWTGALNSDGYGGFTIGNRSWGMVRRRVHRIALELHLWRPLLPGMNANHTRDCPHRHCVRFEHLYEGTQQDNVNDTCANERWSNGWGTSRLKNSDR